MTILHELPPLARMARGLNPTEEMERNVPCFVRHPDAGGQCQRTAAVLVYGLNFCEEHGGEARIGALMEVYRDAGYFFERFRNPHVPNLNDVVERELEEALSRIREEGPGDEDYYRAIRRAHPETPKNVREKIVTWERDEEPRGYCVADHLLDALGTLHKCMRVAFEGEQTWLVETLEYERQSVAVQAAYAMRGREAAVQGT